MQQNSPEDVNDISRKGFAEFEDGRRKDSIKTLSTLRGIGPATASLMLSVYAPEKAPFFSDELFRWSFYETGKGNGWDRRIKYTAKEYDEMYEKVQALLGRLDVSAIDAEKVAYVLGKHDPSMAGAREDSSKSAKRKAGELDGGIAGRNGRQSTNTATFPTERHGTDSEESRSRSLSGAISFKDKDTDQADDDGVQRPSKASQAGRPKRQKRR